MIHKKSRRKAAFFMLEIYRQTIFQHFNPSSEKASRQPKVGENKTKSPIRMRD